MEKKYTIAVAGIGYVGLPIATPLSQHHGMGGCEHGFSSNLGRKNNM